MAITNLDKPSANQPQTELNIGGGFNLLVGGAYRLIINPLTTSFAFLNLARPATEATWESNTTTWATETRTWLDMGSLFDNTAKPTTAISNIAKP